MYFAGAAIGESYLFFGGLFYDLRVGHSFTFHDVLTIYTYLPFVSFRFVFVYQLVTYSKGKSSIERLILAAVVSELPTLLVILFMAPGTFFHYFVAPCPFHLLFGFIILKIRPRELQVPVF